MMHLGVYTTTADEAQKTLSLIKKWAPTDDDECFHGAAETPTTLFSHKIKEVNHLGFGTSFRRSCVYLPIATRYCPMKPLLSI